MKGCLCKNCTHASAGGKGLLWCSCSKFKDTGDWGYPNSHNQNYEDDALFYSKRVDPYDGFKVTPNFGCVHGITRKRACNLILCGRG
jgi:hypothetical protein